MTEKEEKAIYSFNKWIEISEKGHLDNYQIINEDIEDMKTILNMLEQKDKEISELKEGINYWKEYAEGEAGLRKQIQEDYQKQMQELLESEE